MKTHFRVGLLEKAESVRSLLSLEIDLMAHKNGNKRKRDAVVIAGFTALSCRRFSFRHRFRPFHIIVGFRPARLKLRSRVYHF